MSSLPQVKCIIESLAQVVTEKEKTLDSLFQFLGIFSSRVVSDADAAAVAATATKPATYNIINDYTVENVKHNINRIYCLTNLLFKRFGKLKF